MEPGLTRLTVFHRLFKIKVLSLPVGVRIRTLRVCDGVLVAEPVRYRKPAGDGNHSAARSTLSTQKAVVVCGVTMPVTRNPATGTRSNGRGLRVKAVDSHGSLTRVLVLQAVDSSVVLEVRCDSHPVKLSKPIEMAERKLISRFRTSIRV